VNAPADGAFDRPFRDGTKAAIERPGRITTVGACMNRSLLAAAVALATALPGVSFADVSFNVGAVTDYRYRGISQSRLKPALQGGVDWDANGFYLGAWGSTIKWIKDVGGDSDVEIDLYGGYKGEITKDFGFDVGVLTYQYPSNKLDPSANTTELYGALTFGPVTAKYSHSVTNLFGWPDSKKSGYIDVSATFDVAGFGITPHIGHQKVKGPASDASYTDYSLTVSKDVLDSLTVSATLVGTDADKAIYVSPSGKFLGKTGLVVGVKYGF
jgi:uncharacterized protein (TIGR02001 family)